MPVRRLRANPLCDPPAAYPFAPAMRVAQPGRRANEELIGRCLLRLVVCPEQLEWGVAESVFCGLERIGLGRAHRDEVLGL